MRDAAVVVGLLVVLGLAGCGIVLARALDEVEEQQAAEDAREEADVELVSCHTPEVGTMAATVEVVNGSSKRSNYVVDVVFESSDGSRLLGSASIVVDGLLPGQSAEREGVSFEDPAPDFDCRIDDIERFSDERSA